MAPFLNVSPLSLKKPEYGVAGLRDAGVRAEYVRAGETTEDPSSSSSASWEVLVADIDAPPGRLVEEIEFRPLGALIMEVAGGEDVWAPASLLLLLRETALGMFTLFLLVNSVWVSVMVLELIELVVRDAIRPLGGEYRLGWVFEKWRSFACTMLLVRRELLLDMLSARLMLESYKGMLALLGPEALRWLRYCVGSVEERM